MANLRFKDRLCQRTILYSFMLILLGCTSAAVENGVPSIQMRQEAFGAAKQAPDYELPDKIGAIKAPSGFTRVPTRPNSFGDYLRSVSLRTDNDTVFLYNGKPKSAQNLHHAILDIDVGKRDLQQCADAVMRLRGEYLFANQRYNDIHFNFLSDGKPRYYKDHADSEYSHKSFRKYMDYIFSYANTASLKREMKSINVEDMQIGDVFIQQGAPFGHAVIVVDMAENSNGNQLFMIAQSYMPAQDIHVLKNLVNPNHSPWYDLDFGVSLNTPQWLFSDSDLKRF